MIEFSRQVLKNGLTVIVHEDHSTPMVAVNVVYDVGSRDEDPLKTGFAHLFEHLMFGGSKHVPDFDTPIQMAGGENNAFTNSDLTNFYNILPAKNIETGLWLESDRMLELNFSEQALEIQKKVVIEEFKETCLNQPYGDMWHHISEMVYKEHGYRWPTIGRIPEHIAEAKLQDVVDFFYKHYTPCNAVLIIAGKVRTADAFELAQKWFEDIPQGKRFTRERKIEDQKNGFKQKTVYQNVPIPALFRAYKMVDRLHEDYYAVDLLSDVLANGRSSRFFQKLHKDQALFSQVDAFISGTFDAGVFMVEGRPMPEISMDNARGAILKELDILQNQLVDERELQKIKNKVESSLEYSEVNVVHKAMSLAYFEIMGDAELINQEASKYQEVTAADIMRVAQDLLQEENCSELIYLPK